ncbi:hypothetical protein P7K49_022630 [Saguinus oedipus]|uniref:Uncharacterized protein n=1 Tax=Saguinus oedipus TaxID=9490 RepID=A0ABQ9UK84_SAGOE|nr:hypothetical protein P7K49_022630 [Saguinus oedipus]
MWSLGVELPVLGCLCANSTCSRRCSRVGSAPRRPRRRDGLAPGLERSAPGRRRRLTAFTSCCNSVSERRARITKSLTFSNFTAAGPSPRRQGFFVTPGRATCPPNPRLRAGARAGSRFACPRTCGSRARPGRALHGAPGKRAVQALARRAVSCARAGHFPGPKAQDRRRRGDGDPRVRPAAAGRNSASPSADWPPHLGEDAPWTTPPPPLRGAFVSRTQTRRRSPSARGTADANNLDFRAPDWRASEVIDVQSAQWRLRGGGRGQGRCGPGAGRPVALGGVNLVNLQSDQCFWESRRRVANGNGDKAGVRCLRDAVWARRGRGGQWLRERGRRATYGNRAKAGRGGEEAGRPEAPRRRRDGRASGPTGWKGRAKAANGGGGAGGGAARWRWRCGKLRVRAAGGAGRGGAGRGGAGAVRGAPGAPTRPPWDGRSRRRCRARAPSRRGLTRRCLGRRRARGAGGAAMGSQGSPVKSYDYLLKFLLVGDSDVGKGEILESLQDGAAESPPGPRRALLRGLGLGLALPSAAERAQERNAFACVQTQELGGCGVPHSQPSDQRGASGRDGAMGPGSGEGVMGSGSRGMGPGKVSWVRDPGSREGSGEGVVGKVSWVRDPGSGGKMSRVSGV